MKQTFRHLLDKTVHNILLSVRVRYQEERKGTSHLLKVSSVTCDSMPYLAQQRLLLDKYSYMHSYIYMNGTRLVQSNTLVQWNQWAKVSHTSIFLQLRNKRFSFTHIVVMKHGCLCLPRFSKTFSLTCGTCFFYRSMRYIVSQSLGRI